MDYDDANDGANGGAKDEKSGNGLTPLGAILGGLFAADESALSGQGARDKSLAKPAAKSAKGAVEVAGKRGVKRGSRASIEAAAAEISARPTDSEAAYLARELVQCTLPHRDPGEVNGWARTNGNFSLVLQPGFDNKTKKSIGLPYGPLPRLLLLWIVTEAIRTQSRTIRLKDTLNEFLREIGLNPDTGRGPRGDATRLKKQMERLLNCRISFRYSEGSAQKGKSTFLNMEVAREGRFWWDLTNSQSELFESEIVLGEVFFEAITSAPVPVDMRALLPLKKSPLAIDVYTWATYRLHTMQKAGHRQIKISLADLQKQFGSEYNRMDNFKAAFVEALEKVQQVFPALDYRFEGSTFVLRDSRKRPAVAPKDKSAARQKLGEMRPFDLVSEKARAKFKADFAAWDVDAVVADFYAWREEKTQISGNADAHFRAFAKTWVERNR